MTITEPQWTDEQQEKPKPLPGLLPDEYWNARPAFKRIRDAAHSQACSGDVAFWATLSRFSAMISHQIRAQTDIADRASLNLFAAPVGPSGAGKSTGVRVARKLMPSLREDFLDGLPIGTGEGMAESLIAVVEEPTGTFYDKGPHKGDPIMAKVRKQVRHNIFFYVDEGAMIAQLAQRSGSTLGEAIRSAAIGEALGQTNASEDRKRFIPAESYNMGMVIGFQPTTAMPMLAEGGKGTPQRFFWLWATDPSIPLKGSPWPGGIELHRDLFFRDSPLDVQFPQGIKDDLRANIVHRNTGTIEVAELDGHAGLMKVKAAALLALLDERTAVTDDDWALAEMAWECSCVVRDSLIERARREAEAKRQLEEDAKVRVSVRAHEAKSEADRDLRRVAMAIQRHAAVPGGESAGNIRRVLASRDRHLFEKAVDYAITEGLVYEEGDRVCVPAGAVVQASGHRS